MWRKLSCLLLCIAMLAGLAGCGQAASDTGKSEGKTVDKVTSTDNAAAADTAAQNKAYGAALWDIYLYGLLPDGSKLDYSGTQQAEENTFAIYDVDQDGDGLIYFLYSGEEIPTFGDEAKAQRVDGREYEAWRQSYLNGATEITLPTKYITPDNITPLGCPMP